MIIAIVKDLYAVLENKKCKSTELGTLIWSDQSSEVLDACQLLITGKKKKKNLIIHSYITNVSNFIPIDKCHWQ